MSTYKNNPEIKIENEKEVEKPIPIDGFQQIVEMLKIADPAFRESLLNRLAVKDRKLANSLRRDLSNLDI